MTKAHSSDQLLDQIERAVADIEALQLECTVLVRSAVSREGRISADLIDQQQHLVHGLAWLATYVQSIRELGRYGRRLAADGRLGTLELLLIRIGCGEYLAQIFGGIALNQGEIIRLGTFGLARDQIGHRLTPVIAQLIDAGNTAEHRADLAALMSQADPAGLIGATGLDPTFEEIRDQMRRFARAEVLPFAHQWHLKNDYIPIEVVEKLGEFGVFGLTISEEYGGLGLGKIAMCVVSEELSRAYIGVGSLGTRSEIAAELILTSGTDEQKDAFLARIADGSLLPTAVFTEPDTGSDLANLRTKAALSGDNYAVYGNKTWITHPVRADLMTLLVRTGAPDSGYRGLSMLLAEKPRGNDADPFPAKGMAGSEIEVLGYRGMKEFEIAFDGFKVPRSRLLGGVEGQGFKQLMQTFESARIQTAARACGVAQSALDLGLRYGLERRQFGKPLIAFPRVADKLALMAVEVNIARQLTYFAAREKDGGRRCDLEAGMAKLLGARIAWAAADNALQIHGGNGFALEFEISRVLCDARILNIFEGAAEIQAQVIGRRLLDTSN